MSRKILQINFKFHASRAEYEAAVAPLAEPIATVPGLLWRVWLVNEAGQEAGGIYLFADGRSLQSYLDSETVASIVNHPLLSDVSVKQFDVIEAASDARAGGSGRCRSMGDKRRPWLLSPDALPPSKRRRWHCQTASTRSRMTPVVCDNFGQDVSQNHLLRPWVLS
jgi:hypothetical protein